MKTFKRQITNLDYVTIDREAALNHWMACVEVMDSLFGAVNYDAVIRIKTTAGILGHRGHGGGNWARYFLKEKVLFNRLK